MAGKKDIVEQALKLVMGGAETAAPKIRAYHASPHDFDVFKPSEFRGSTFFASTPERAKRGADAGRNEMVMETATDLPPANYKTYEVEIDPTKIKGLHLTPSEIEWFGKLPNKIVGDEALEAATRAGMPHGLTWDDFYDYKPISEGVFEYTKKAAPPSITYEDAYKTGRNVYRRQHSHYAPDADEKASAERMRQSGMGGYMLQDEGGTSLAVSDPEIVKILRKYASGGRTGYQTKGRVVGDAVDAAMRLIAGAEPQKTAKAYKLFKQREGKLYPLFVDANEEVPLNQWLKAKAGEQAASGKVRSKIGELAYRPGWHAGDLPIATHIGARSHGNPKLPPDTRPSDQVWAEVDMADDVDWQKIADERARMTKKGTPDPKTAHITDQVPYGGYYRYKTNPNMTGNWMIGGDMRVNRVLTDDEVRAINEAAGVSDLPRREGYAGRGRVVEKALKAVTDYFAPNTDEYAANLGKFYGSTDPALRKRFYTGTSKDKDFTAFQESRHGTWLTDSPEDASSYALSNDSMGYRPGPGWTYEKTNQASRVIPAYAKIENPYRGEKPDWVMKQDNYKKAQSDWFDQLRAQGYDAWVPDSGNGGLAVVLKGQGTNVKSAIGNQGTFDPTKKHMGKSEGGRAGYGPGGVIDDIVKMAGKIVSGADEPAKTGIRAYHGSPHDFDRFDMSKIGTGEGAQAYGHGLYFAESEPVAKGYRRSLSGPETMGTVTFDGKTLIDKGTPAEGWYDPSLIISDDIHARDITPDLLRYGNVQDAVPKLREKAQHDMEMYENVKNENYRARALKSAKLYSTMADFIEKNPDRYGVRLPGHMYEVNIAADPNAFLDWDKSLLLNHPLRDTIADAAMKASGSTWAQARNSGRDAMLAARNENLTGEGAYHQLSKMFETSDDAWQSISKTPNELLNTKAAASEALKQSGIPGIKYLDAGSRGAGDGTRNYVVFDDRLISIIRKYGIAGASAMLGYNLMEQLDPKQALAASMADQEFQSSRPKRSMGGNNSVSGALNVARGLHGGM